MTSGREKGGIHSGGQPGLSQPAHGVYNPPLPAGKPIGPGRVWRFLSMEIAVLVKQVPDTAEVKIDPKTGTLIREGVEGVVNPEDLNAVEAALVLKARHGGCVTVLTMGPPQAREALLETLAMGADRAVHLTDKAFAGADTLATSYTLGKAVEKLGPFDLVICGRQAIDGDTAQIGPQVAEYLGIPQATYVQEIEIRDGVLRAVRRLDAGTETIETPLPALVTVLGSLNSPRLPTVPGIIDACSSKDRLSVMNAADIGARAEKTGLRGSPTVVWKTETPKSERRCEMLKGSPAVQAQALAAILKKRNLS